MIRHRSYCEVQETSQDSVFFSQDSLYKYERMEKRSKAVGNHRLLGLRTRSSLCAFHHFLFSATLPSPSRLQSLSSRRRIWSKAAQTEIIACSVNTFNNNNFNPEVILKKLVVLTKFKTTMVKSN